MPSGPPGPAAAPLRTARLRLDPWRPGHARALFAGLSDPLLYRFLDERPPPDVAALARRLACRPRNGASGPARRRPADRWYGWTVSRTAGGCLGIAQATLEARHPGRALVGVVVFQAHWRQGIGTDAVGCMLDWLFGSCGCHAADALVDGANAASLAMLGRLGFEPEEARGVEVALCLRRDRWRR